MPVVHRILTRSQFLAPPQNNEDRQLARLEVLPAELAAMVQDRLSGNDLIMLCLTSKRLAWQSPLSRTRKIANIAWFELHIDDADANPTEEAWRRLGFLEMSLGPSLGRAGIASKAVCDQSMDLRSRLREGTLLEEHGFCYVCHKFRPLAQRYWYDLSEHVEQGSTRLGTETQRIAEELSRKWAVHGGNGDPALCPAHKLLTETWPE